MRRSSDMLAQKHFLLAVLLGIGTRQTSAKPKPKMHLNGYHSYAAKQASHVTQAEHGTGKSSRVDAEGLKSLAVC